jgi:hypothetical protein
VSAEEETAPRETAAPADGEQPKLRRRPFGYSKRDVRQALDRQSAELGAREAELAELRQDVAALWLAFAQHDRMIRRALGEGPAPERSAPSEPSAAADSAPAPQAAKPADVADEAAIGRQLSDLDDVLAAIELATQTLEKTYASESERPTAAPPAEGDAPPAEGAGEDAERRAAG